MNCISGSLLLVCLFTCSACDAPASESNPRPRSVEYKVHYSITPAAGAGVTAVEMRVEQSRQRLRDIEFEFDPQVFSDFRATAGVLQVQNNAVRWQPAASGGSLSWNALVPHRRNGDGYDAWLGNNWGIFRAEDIIPRASSRTLRGAVSDTTMDFQLPVGWSVISEYAQTDDLILVTNADRRFDQPAGWLAMGRLGVRRETIAGSRVAVAAPQGQNVRRMDMLALLNWVLPEINRVLPGRIPRLTIISAGDPMWRGGLSAPASLFIHADRPLISENATSSLIHEVVHVALGIRARAGFDWIVEGLAEYYSLELLQRGGAITARRYQQALDDQSEWAKDAKALCGNASSGASTALAVIRFRDLDTELRNKSRGAVSLDNVVARLAKRTNKVSLRTLSSITSDLLGEASETLRIGNLPGCASAASDPGN